MKKVDMLVTAPFFYTMEGDGVGFKENVVMVIDRGRIIDFVDKNKCKNLYSAEEDIVLDHHAVFPGFIDAHMHTACNVMRGLAQDTNNWMMHGLQPFENVATSEARDAGSYVAIIEAIKAGTTTIGDFEKDMENVCKFIEKVGVRGNIAQVVRSAKYKVYNPGELYEFDKQEGEKSLNKNIDLYKRWNNKDGGRIKILYGPQGADFVEASMLERIQKLAKDHKTKIHMHVQQGDRETYQIEKRYGKRPTEYLNDLGLLDETLIAVHLTDCNPDETEIIAKSGASMIVNPGSIAIIDGVVCPSVEFQRAGGYVALGSDQAPGNNCHNIINEMKNVALFNKIKYKDPEVMPAWKALRMATIEGAKAIGLGQDIGSLEIGKKADFIAIDLKQPSMQPVYTWPMRNIVPNLVYSARGHEVDLSVVDGRVIMSKQKIIGIDEMDYINQLGNYPDDLGHKAEKEFFEVNGINAQFMREGKL